MRRRGFLTGLAASMPALLVKGRETTVSAPTDAPSDALGPVLRKRRLGPSGEAVTMLGIGGYHLGWTSERDAREVIEAALEGGIRFFDSAESYQDGESERRYGKYLVPRYREQVFLMTKTQARNAADARKHLEGSLRRLRTDYIDLWQVHSLREPGDVDDRVESGVLDVLREAKEQGKVRHIGFTGHTNPEAHLRFLDRTNNGEGLETCQMPVNVLDPSYHSFIEQVIPRLRQRGIGLLAMKTLADGRFFGTKPMGERVLWQTEDPAVPTRLSVRDALHFAWALPVSVLVTGAENASLVREKCDLARSFTGMDARQRARLIERAADLADGRVEYYKRPVS